MRRLFWTGFWSIWGMATVLLLLWWIWLGRQQQWPDTVGYVWQDGAVAASGHADVLMVLRIRIKPGTVDLPRVRGFVRGLDRLPVGGPSTGWRSTGNWNCWFAGGYRQTCRWGDLWMVGISPWRVLELLAVAPVVAVARRGWRKLRKWKRARDGLCAGCGYDLRATPDVCPECGMRASGNGRDVHATAQTAPSPGD